MNMWVKQYNVTWNISEKDKFTFLNLLCSAFPWLSDGDEAVLFWDYSVKQTCFKCCRFLVQVNSVWELKNAELCTISYTTQSTQNIPEDLHFLSLTGSSWRYFITICWQPLEVSEVWGLCLPASSVTFLGALLWTSLPIGRPRNVKPRIYIAYLTVCDLH